MLQIRLSKQPAEPARPVKPSPAETVTVACPDHLVLADLPVAKGIGAANAATVSNTLGRRSRRLLGERVHFCVRCDFPIAVYGRLSPCEHAFCLDCARSDSICYLCDGSIQKIQTIKLMEGIFVCAAPHCLKSFLKMDDFTSHIHESHSDLLHQNSFCDDANEQDTHIIKQGSMDFFRGPPRPIAPLTLGLQNMEVDDKNRRLLPLQRPMMPSKQPIFAQMPNFYLENHPLPNHYHQQPESGQPSEAPNADFHPPPHYVMPMDPTLGGPQFGMPPFHDGGTHMVNRSDAAPEDGSEPNSLLGFPPAPVAAMNYMANYSQPWTHEFHAKFTTTDSQASPSFFHNDYGRGSAAPPRVAAPLRPPSSGDKNMEATPLPYQHHLPPPQLSQIPQPLRNRRFSSDRPRDGQSYGWPHENPTQG